MLREAFLCWVLLSPIIHSGQFATCLAVPSTNSQYSLSFLVSFSAGLDLLIGTAIDLQFSALCRQRTPRQRAAHAEDMKLVALGHEGVQCSDPSLLLFHLQSFS